ncbi:copper resistance protein CopC [Kitasatospora sp. NPDC058965]|uniref:copper resistance CopC/CopD family protein n=1 Tax=Kitasatospora sp. NPDC058965 TaxID=3346682 RepID=UPI003691C526
MRRLRQVAVVLLVLCGLALGTAGPAAAHAGLVTASPADGSVLAGAPPQVRLVFSEPVTLRLASVRVIGPDGRRVDTGAPVAGDGDALLESLAAGGQQGTFVVQWRVTAADDGHTTAGVLTFSVGAPSRNAALGAGGRSDRSTEAVLDLAVWLGFAGLAAMVGFAAVRLYCLPVGGAVDGLPVDPVADALPADPAEDGLSTAAADALPAEPAAARPSAAPVADGAGGPHPALARLPGAGWSALLLGTLLQLFAYGPATQGESLAHLADRPLLAATLSGHQGQMLVGRILLLALTATVGPPLLRRVGTVARAGAVLLTLLLALTWAETSHAAGGTLVPLALLATTLHVTAMAVWAGGVGTLALLAVRAGAGAQLAAAAARFSRLAVAAVALLAVTGAWQAFREVGSPAALTGTPYGRLLLAKVAVLALVLAAAAVVRGRVRRPAAGPGVRRAVLLELAGVTVLLVLTVVMVGTAPARPATAAGRPQSTVTILTTAAPGLAN